MRIKLPVLALTGFLLSGSSLLHAQDKKSGKLLNQTIRQEQTTRLLTVLSADNMEGRKYGTPGIHRAAAVIARQFKEAGLQPVK